MGVTWKPFPVLNHVPNSIQLNFNLHLASTPIPPNREVYKCFLDSLMSCEIKGQKTTEKMDRRWGSRWGGRGYPDAGVDRRVGQAPSLRPALMLPGDRLQVLLVRGHVILGLGEF